MRTASERRRAAAATASDGSDGERELRREPFAVMVDPDAPSPSNPNLREYLHWYKPGEEFEEDTNDPLVDFSMADSTELWLIQWPVKLLKPTDFHGKEVKLKLHRDGQLGSLETSSGKSYDLVSHAAQEPDATVFLPTSSNSKVVGKISRRVCLRHYPEPEEFELPTFSNAIRSNLRGSGRSSSHRSTVLKGSKGTVDTFNFPHSTEETPQPSRKKRREEHRSGDGASRGSRPDSHLTDGSLASDRSHGNQSKKKDKKIKDAE